MHCCADADPERITEILATPSTYTRISGAAALAVAATSIRRDVRHRDVLRWGNGSDRQHRVADRRQHGRVMAGMIAGGWGDHAGRLQRPVQPVKGCPTAFGSEQLFIRGRGNQRHAGSALSKRCQNVLRQPHESDPAHHPQDVSREVVVHEALRPLPSRVEDCDQALCPDLGGPAAAVSPAALSRSALFRTYHCDSKVGVTRQFHGSRLIRIADCARTVRAT